MNLPVVNTDLESSPERSWRARLELAFRAGRERTVMTHAAHEGPLRVQRLFYPEAGGKAHCYLLHPPGGVVLGDALEVDVSVASGSVLLTTPSAGRFYSGRGFFEEQLQRVRLRADGGILEWLPQETILFAGARARLHTSIELAAEAQLAYWDVLVLGRPACGEAFDSGLCEQRLDIRRDGRPLYLDRLDLRAGDRLSRARLGLNGASTVGLAAFTHRATDALVERWRHTAAAMDPAGAFSITQRGELLLARYLGEDAQRCRAAFSILWRDLGHEREGRSPVEPRIWHT
ncbi:MAG: urease accessory protein UreD [Halieaceae bacterium]|nr:urease accessory protein UreD [Halieaceae bacterium]